MNLPESRSWSATLRGMLPPRLYLVTEAVTLLAVLAMAWSTEIDAFGYVLVLLFYALVRTGMRLLFVGRFNAQLMTLLVIGFVYGASKAKFWLTSRRLHPYDLYVYFDISNLKFIDILYPGYLPWIYGGVGLLTALVVLLLVLDRSRRPRLVSVAGFVMILAGSVALYAQTRNAEGRGFGWGNRFLHFDHKHISTFVLSSLHALPDLVAGEMFNYGPPVPVDPEAVRAAADTGCKLDPGRTHPHVMTILRESVMPLSRYPAVRAPAIDEAMFASDDGRTPKLRVETYGGGSAYTIFSLLAGISTEAFGGFKNIALDVSINRITGTLPMLMRECGYRTVAVTAAFDGYVASREFYEKIGFDKVYLYNEVLAKAGGDHSDRSFYAFVLDLMQADQSGKPLFIYMDTTASHAPYDKPLRPAEIVPEVATMQPGPVAEYARRIVLGERDRTAFLGRMNEMGPQARGLVMLDFGDHHPEFTKSLPGGPGVVNEDPMVDDPLMITYFRLASVRFPLAARPADHPLVDVGFMRDWLLTGLGWRQEGLHGYRWQHVTACRSRYWRCTDPQAMNRFHQTLRQAGILALP